MRLRWLVALLGMALLLGACAEAERIAGPREILVHEDESRTYRYSWTSDRYGDRTFETDQIDTALASCFARTAEGEHLDESCLTHSLLLMDTNAYYRNRWVAWIATIAALAGLVWFANRRVAWQPLVDPETGHRAAGSAPGTGESAIDLMRSVETEKGKQVQATAARRDIPRVTLAGSALAVLVLAPLTLLLGYGTALSWGMVTGGLLAFGVAGTSTLLLLGMLTRSDLDPLIRRLFFLGAVGVVMFALAYAGLGFRGPLLELNGLSWPG